MKGLYPSESVALFMSRCHLHEILFLTYSQQVLRVNYSLVLLVVCSVVRNILLYGGMIWLRCSLFSHLFDYDFPAAKTTSRYWLCKSLFANMSMTFFGCKACARATDVSDVDTNSCRFPCFKFSWRFSIEVHCHSCEVIHLWPVLQILKP